MRIFIICLTFLVASSLASAQSPDPAIEGYRLSFQLGQEYQKVMVEGGSATAYNALVEKWNAFVIANYGNSSNMLMQPIGAENAYLTKPIAIGKNITSNGIVHTIDGSGKNGPSWVTNDINQMSDSARLAYQAQDSRTDPVTGKPVAGAGMGDGYLGGI